MSKICGCVVGLGMVVMLWLSLIRSSRALVSSSCSKSSISRGSMRPSSSSSSSSLVGNKIEIVKEGTWRPLAEEHVRSIVELLEPGFLVEPDSTLETKKLNPQHPTYNFLIEYYGIKGSKGVRKLTRWMPNWHQYMKTTYVHGSSTVANKKEEEDVEEEQKVTNAIATIMQEQEEELNWDGIVLLGANQDDLCAHLHLKGAYPLLVNNDDTNTNTNNTNKKKKEWLGVWYPMPRMTDVSSANGLIWYHDLIRSVVEREPVLHCFGLHEWAMLYTSSTASDEEVAESRKYQKDLPLRVSQQVINETVERKGVSCTHVDALRFFAPSALPLNSYMKSFDRSQQPQKEQPGCVHSHMDMIKQVLRLVPYVDATLLKHILDVAIQARSIDMRASPYHVPSPICIETPEGRAQYKQEQIQLLQRAQPIRTQLLQTYRTYLTTIYGPDILTNTKLQ